MVENHLSSIPPEDCRQLLAIMSDYIDGELPESTCDDIRRHMAECEDCRVVIDTLNKTILLYQQAPTPTELPHEVSQRLFAALKLDDFLPHDPNNPTT